MYILNCKNKTQLYISQCVVHPSYSRSYSLILLLYGALSPKHYNIHRNTVFSKRSIQEIDNSCCFRCDVINIISHCSSKFLTVQKVYTKSLTFVTICLFLLHTGAIIRYKRYQLHTYRVSQKYPNNYSFKKYW